MARSGVWILLVFLAAPAAAQDAAEAQESRVEVVGGAGAFVTEKTTRPWAEVFVGGGIVFQDAEVPVGHLSGGIQSAWLAATPSLGVALHRVDEGDEAVPHVQPPALGCSGYRASSNSSSSDSESNRSSNQIESSSSRQFQ